MKTLSALLYFALGCTLVSAAPKPPAKPAAAPAKAEAAAEAKDTLDEKNLVGLLLARNGGGFVNLKVDGGHFVMAFYDAEKKVAAPDVTSATVTYRKGKATHRHLLTAGGDGKSLQAPTPVDRPYIFNTTRVVLFDNNEETATEAYTVNFKQPMPGDGEGTPVEEMTPEQLRKIKE